MIHEHRPIQPLSKRTALFEESVIREMTRLGDEAGAINLSQGLPDFDTPREILAAAEQAIQAGENQYTFPFGDLAFRQSIARKSASYNRLLADPESEITVTCGVSEAIMATFFALTEPGDEIVLFDYETTGIKPRRHEDTEKKLKSLCLCGQLIFRGPHFFTGKRNVNTVPRGSSWRLRTSIWPPCNSTIR